MNKSENYVIPRYLKIAVNLSERIATGNISEGSKLKGRSVLSTQYGVSPETIRKAMALLSEKDVVKIYNGKGIYVLSKENAAQFIKSFKGDEEIQDLRFQLSKEYEKLQVAEKSILKLTNKIIDMYKYKRSDLVTPIAIKLPKNSHVIGHSIKELEIWHKTGATVVAIMQSNETTVSPGPYYVFSANDVVIIAGDNKVVERFNAFINGITI